MQAFNVFNPQICWIYEKNIRKGHSVFVCCYNSLLFFELTNHGWYFILKIKTFSWNTLQNDQVESQGSSCFPSPNMLELWKSIRKGSSVFVCCYNSLLFFELANHGWYDILKTILDQRGENEAPRFSWGWLWPRINHKGQLWTWSYFAATMG